jgi:hypothetical protein
MNKCVVIDSRGGNKSKRDIPGEPASLNTLVALSTASMYFSFAIIPLPYVKPTIVAVANLTCKMIHSVIDDVMSAGL